MNVIHVPLEIELIANRVLPESLLPHAAKAFAPLAGRYGTDQYRDSLPFTSRSDVKGYGAVLSR